MQTEIRQTFPSGPEEMAKASVPSGRLATTQEQANVIAFMLSDEASFVNGSIYTCDGGWISGYG